MASFFQFIGLLIFVIGIHIFLSSVIYNGVKNGIIEAQEELSKKRYGEE